MNSYSLDDALHYVYDDYDMLCRIKKIDGGTFYIVTPHGTTVKLGFIWVIKCCTKCTEEELVKLKHYEDSALEKLGHMYKIAEYPHTP